MAKEPESVTGSSKTNVTQDGAVRAKRKPAPVEEKTLSKFTVRNATIKDAFGNKRKRGEMVELPPKLAKHYNALDLLSPYIEDEE